MGVIMHAHYRLMGPDGQKIVMPAPVDKATPDAPWWWDHLANQAAEFRRSGFTAVMLPPACKTASGAASDSDGYGLFDDYDIGSKSQFYSIPTRFGDGERLRRLIGILHACGMQAYADVVLHQYYGGENGTYTYFGADGKTKNGRFPKHPSCFVGAPPRVPVDPVANPEGNYAFGDMCAYLNSTPARYMIDGAIDAGDWLTNTLGVDGYRVDDTKGMAVAAVREFLESKAMASRFAVSEYFDGNPYNLHWWVDNSGMGGRSSAFDFNLHWAIQSICDANGWMGQLDGAGLIAIDPIHAVTFVDNPDTDLSYGENVIWNKMLGYALILTLEGYPSIYYKDYSTDANCYGLKPHIDNLIWIHENLAFGNTTTRWGNDPHVFAYERQGEPGLLVALSNDLNNQHDISLQTNFGANVRLHDYAGHHDDVWTNNLGVASINLPRNVNGLSYVCFSRTGYAQGFAIHPIATTQTFYGAADLDTPQVETGLALMPGRIWCAAGSEIIAHLEIDTAGWPPGAEVTVELRGDDGADLLVDAVYTSTFKDQRLKAVAKKAGFHQFRLMGIGLPAAGSPYQLKVTYTGTEGLGL